MKERRPGGAEDASSVPQCRTQARERARLGKAAKALNTCDRRRGKANVSRRMHVEHEHLVSLVDLVQDRFGGTLVVPEPVELERVDDPVVHEIPSRKRLREECVRMHRALSEGLDAFGGTAQARDIAAEMFVPLHICPVHIQRSAANCDCSPPRAYRRMSYTYPQDVGVGLDDANIHSSTCNQSSALDGFAPTRPFDLDFGLPTARRSKRAKYSEVQKYTSLLPLPESLRHVTSFDVLPDKRDQPRGTALRRRNSILPATLPGQGQPQAHEARVPTSQAGSELDGHVGLGTRLKLGFETMDEAARAIAEKQDSRMELVRTRAAQSRHRRKPEPFGMTLSRRRQFARCGLCPDVMPASAHDMDALFASERDLVGPFATKNGRLSLYVHFECATWAPEIFLDVDGAQFRNVYDAYSRGRRLWCAHCGQKGATVGCYTESCRRAFHYCCLRAAKCRLLLEHFTAFCSEHASRADLPMTRQLILAQAALAAQRHAEASPEDETTAGLDCPHSCYTGLRRNETELIFSASWKRVSVDFASTESARAEFEMRVLYLRRQGRLMALNHRMRAWSPTPYRTHPSCVRATAFDAIAGQIEAKAEELRNKVRLLGASLGVQIINADPESKLAEQHNSTMPCAAVPPKATSSALFLLRNFYGCTRELEDVTAEQQHEPSTLPQLSRGKNRRVFELGGARYVSERKTGALKSVQSDRVTCVRREGSRVAGSGWMLFVTEQEEEEQRARPKDDRAQRRINLARKWCLLEPEQREEYCKRALESAVDTVAGVVSLSHAPS
ncbi:Histone-lysine N-methyltransferase trithorax [Porphyridium purpureum]|uniref:Histone-lysine N-methyltransferase trithorax n=1 Tax=Porphyridium purpureum TaxID=35688 RepID=A0A5J4YRH4_PORPP|nr:Histone-lysine N-methyltransferase trithorax [Porphyridium purpureum]|eukprot:POR4643..scf296_7